LVVYLNDNNKKIVDKLLKTFLLENSVEVGCDEAGRGCLAGPVVAAAVILPPTFQHSLLNDSKKLSEKTRLFLEPLIKEQAISFGIGEVSEREIEEINILNASILAMHRAIENLKVVPEHIIVDGNKFKPFGKIPHQCMIKGDSKYLSIAAASVLAKNYRDELMLKLHADFPQYAWDKNKGYPTKTHRKAILTFGPTQFHRMTFNLLGDSVQLDLFP
jgi:ribonuclease HII